MRTAQEMIAALGLEPHPEGGYFRETFRDSAPVGGRAASTAIYYLLAAGQRSHWHRVDATEVWHWYAGAPLSLRVSFEGKTQTVTLGNVLEYGQVPQYVVLPQVWQSAQSTGEWTLVGCTVAPGFEFSGFEMAPTDWQP
jgi:predicted cupin superfamily sugar epimerase